MFLRPIRNKILCIFKRIINDDFPGMASEMAFMFVFGIFPFLIFLMSFFTWLGKTSLMDELLTFFNSIAPKQIMYLVDCALKEVFIFKQDGLLALIGFFVTVALTSNAIAVIIKGLNRAYGVKETRSFLVTRCLSVLMVFVNVFLLFISINLIIFGKVILEIILTFISIPQSTVNLILIVRWPIAFLCIFTVTYLNYLLLPDIKGCEKDKIKSAFLGTFFFCVFWLLGSWIFSIYVNNLNTYNKVYGTIGAFVMLMVWLYYASLLILIGGEINSQVYKKLSAKNKLR